MKRKETVSRKFACSQIFNFHFNFMAFEILNNKDVFVYFSYDHNPRANTGTLKRMRVLVKSRG